jgi:SAM-dependent methyltransferase
VLSLLAPEHLHPESAAEMHAREERNQAILEGARKEWSSPATDEIEVRATLEALDCRAGSMVCELGCGPGRYTLKLAGSAHAVVAVDFSLAGLRVLRQKLEPCARVGIVQADVTRPYGAPRAYDRILSTLHSNLPGRDHRSKSLAQIARTLVDGGRAVVSMHHYGVREILGRVPASGRYPDSGIYRYFMTVRESGEEASRFFERLRHVHIAVSIPGVRSVTVSRAAARVPLVRSSLGRLFLAIGEHPQRSQELEIPQCA